MTAMSTVVANLDGSGYGAVIETPSLHPGTFSILMPWVSGTNIVPVWIRRLSVYVLKITFRSFFFFFLVPAALFDQVNREQCTRALFMSPTNSTFQSLFH